MENLFYSQGLKLETIKIRMMASLDWSLLYTMEKFLSFYDPTVNYKGKKFKLDFGLLKARVITCGEDVRKDADVLVDRCVHWNAFYKFYAQQAANCGVIQVNNPVTNDNLDKHHSYDLISRAMHPKDRLPTTALLPQWSPWTPDQLRQETWESKETYQISATQFGWDPTRKKMDKKKLEKNLNSLERYAKQRVKIRNLYYPSHNYIAETVERDFKNQFPLYFKKAFGGGGSDVHKIKNLEELYQKYDESDGKVFAIQEAIENYDTFIRCMGIGPQILALRFQPDEPLHQHYSPEILKVDKVIWQRTENYVRFINSFYGWTYNSFECLVKDGAIHPIDFANACPDSNFTSLHTHFPWLICSLIKWFSFLGAVRPELGTDTRIREYMKVFNDPKKSAEDKYHFHVEKSGEFFQDKVFNKFVEENFSDIEEKMIHFFDKHFDEVIEFSIENSDFPEEERKNMVGYYQKMMKEQFRANPLEYLKTDVHG